MKLFSREVTFKKILRNPVKAMKIIGDIFHLRLVCFFLPFILRWFPSSLTLIIGDKSESRYLPRSNERIELTDDPLDDFVCVPISPLRFEEVNLIFRGDSLDQRDIDKSLPTFFLNIDCKNNFDEYKKKWLASGDLMIFARNMGLSEEPSFYRERSEGWKVFYISGYAGTAEYAGSTFSTIGLSQVYNGLADGLAKMNIKHPTEGFDCSFVTHRSMVTNLKLGSGIGMLVSLLTISERVNVYGWDQYCQEEWPSTYIRQIKILCTKKHLQMANVITSLINWIYAYRFIDKHSDRVKVNGRILMVSNFNWIPRSAFKVLYKL